jgi:hypothetical protein
LSSPPSSPTIVGSAVATIVWSSDASSSASISPAKTERTVRAGTSLFAIALCLLRRPAG